MLRQDYRIPVILSLPFFPLPIRLPDVIRIRAQTSCSNLRAAIADHLASGGIYLTPESMHPNRRTFLSRAGAATLAAGVIGIEPLLQNERSTVQAADGSNQRSNNCAKLRRDAATAGVK